MEMCVKQNQLLRFSPTSVPPSLQINKNTAPSISVALRVLKLQRFLINPLPSSVIQPRGKEAREMEGRGEKKKKERREEIIRKHSSELRGISHLIPR